jgi:hypothetical protein
MQNISAQIPLLYPTTMPHPHPKMQGTQTSSALHTQPHERLHPTDFPRLSAQVDRNKGTLTGPYWFISLFCVSCKAATVAVAVAVAVAAAAATAAAAAAAAG